jgi:hypothetical protein
MRNSRIDKASAVVYVHFDVQTYEGPQQVTLRFFFSLSHGGFYSCQVHKYYYIHKINNPVKLQLALPYQQCL